MQTKGIRMVEQKYTVWKCDFCDYETETNRGCCGTAPIMSCDFCGKDACRDHREYYRENEWEDYPDFIACKDCIDIANKCQYIAGQVAERYDNWWDVVKKIHDNFDEYKIYLEDYEEPQDIEPVDINDLIGE